MPSGPGSSGRPSPFLMATSHRETALKFCVDPRLLRRGLLETGYTELPVAGTHAVAVDLLPPIHRDPFDRLLVAQAQIEGLTLFTVDPVVAPPRAHPVALVTHR